MLFDSPLNRAGLLQVFVRTEHNVLIEINPQTRIPRTFKRFAGLMVQLLHKFQIRANDTSRRLMSVIKNPITDHLPVGCKKYAMSFSGKLVTNCRELVPHGDEGSKSYDEPVVMVIGAFAHGVLKSDYTEGYSPLAIIRFRRLLPARNSAPHSRRYGVWCSCSPPINH